MEIWFLRDNHRFAAERRAIQQLQEAAEWLLGAEWVIDAGLCIDADLRVHGRDYQVRMIYPNLFPHVPPIVKPRNPQERWSTHQYSDGTLCLEWGPDTWQPEVTGAQVLESAYKLLYIENPLDSERQMVAPSRHKLSVGQTLRSKYGRFYAGKGLCDYLINLPGNSHGLIEFSILWQSNSFMVLVQKVQTYDLLIWEDGSIPVGVRATENKGTLKKGIFQKTNLDGGIIDKITKLKEIEDVLRSAGYVVTLINDEGGELPKGSEQPLSGLLLTDSANNLHFFLFLGEYFSHLASIVSDIGEHNLRISPNLQAFSGKSVGIVGLGSVGSKMTLSLARAGINRFLLVDEDVFLPENICRHMLDWQNVGEHKVDSIKEILFRISPGINVEVSRLNLTGQESVASVSGILDRLGSSDLIIDATANPQVFNLLAGVAKTFSRPLVWMEVYAGGIGGFMARSRPDRDPDPYTMRAAYHHFTAETPSPKLVNSRDYIATNGEGTVISATDAEVSILAHYAAHLAIDTLLAAEPSKFPHSMYLIGLARSWIFEEPFHTIPIETTKLPQGINSNNPPDEVVNGNLKFIGNLIKKQTDADSAP